VMGKRKCTPWVRTVLRMLLVGLVLASSVLLAPAAHLSLVPWAILPSLIAAFLLGVRITAWWWAAAAGLAAVPAAVAGGVMVVHATASVTGGQVPGSEVAYAIMMGSIVTGAAVVVGVLHALAAIVGVWRGTRRAGISFAPAPVAARELAGSGPARGSSATSSASEVTSFPSPI
jgi:hypothetical protein